MDDCVTPVILDFKVWKTLHILYIYKDYYPVLGGIENHIHVLAEGMAARGHQVTVLVTSTGRTDEYSVVGNLTIIKAARIAQLASTPLSLQMFRHARQIRQVDVVDLQFPYPPGDIVARLVPHNPPLVVSYHSDIVRQRTLLRMYSPLLEDTLARARQIIVASPAYSATSPWLSRHMDRCVVVPYGIDIQRFRTCNPEMVEELRTCYDGMPIVLFVGHLRYYKGLTFLIAALKHLRTPAHLLIVGSGAEQNRLEQQMKEADLTGRVHFLGEVGDADLPAIYAAADIFVLPSHLRSEAFGIVQLEAQVAGLPIVCTELGSGTSFVTQHGRTGLVVPPANPLALARAIDLLLANPDLAQRMGAAGRARAIQEFSHSRMIDRKEAIYRSVI